MRRRPLYGGAATPGWASCNLRGAPPGAIIPRLFPFPAFVAAFTLATPSLAAARLDELAAALGVRTHSVQLANGWVAAQHAHAADEDGEAEDEGDEPEAENPLAERVSLGVLGEAQRLPGEAARLAGVGLESDVDLGALPRLGGQASLHFEYRQHTRLAGAASQAQFSFEKRKGRFEGLLDVTVDRPLAPGGDAGYGAYGYAASATWRTLGELRFGVQALGGVGEDHGFKDGAHGAFVGPQVKWKSRPGLIPADLAVDAGWLATFGQARRAGAGQARVNLELKRKF